MYVTVPVSDAAVGVVLRIARLAAHPFLHERLLLHAFGGQGPREHGAQTVVAFDPVIEAVDDSGDHGPAADPFEQSLIGTQP